MASRPQSERRSRTRYLRVRPSKRAQAILVASVLGGTLAITGAIWLVRAWWDSGVLGGLAVAAAATLVFSFLWFVPKLQLASVREHLGKDYPRTENDLRGTWAQIIGGLVLLASLGFTWLQSNETRLATQRSLQITERGQITDRFTTAIDQLGDDRLELRLGGIYSLEQIAVDAPESHYWPVMQVLTAFVRANAPLADPSGDIATPATAPSGSPAPDVQAVLTVLGQRDTRWDEGTLDLRRTDLRNADLQGAQLGNMLLTEANLENANLTSAQLTEAQLRSANLAGALLIGAVMRRAHLENANLSSADLINTQLDGAWLQYADLSSAFLIGATLDGARLEGADLQGALGLTQEQIDAATVDETTQLPPDVVPPIAAPTPEGG